MKRTQLSRFLLLTVTLFTAALCIAGCTITPGPFDFRCSETQLEEAREQAFVTCSTPIDCDQVWNRVRLYVQLHSPTPIRRMDDTSIETDMPHTFGVAWFWAERTTANDGVTTVRLKGMCRGMYDADGDPAWIYSRCANQIRQAELAFRQQVGSAQ